MTIQQWMAEQEAVRVRRAMRQRPPPTPMPIGVEPARMKMRFTRPWLDRALNVGVAVVAAAFFAIVGAFLARM